MSTIIDWILRRARSALALIGLLLLVSFASLSQLHFDNTPDSFFMKNDPALKLYTQYKKDFGSDEYSFLVLQAPQAWTPGFIEDMRALTDRIERLPDVNRVTSITNVRHIDGTAGGLDVGEFLDAGLTVETLATKRAEALAHPFYRDFLVSADGRHVGILAETALRPNEIAYKIELANKLRVMIDEPRFRGYQGRLIGAPIIDADVFSIINRESALFGTLSFLLVAAGFYFIFRSWLGAMLPLIVASLSIVVAMAATAWIGAPLGMLTAIIPSFLISVGVGSSVFLLAEIYRLHASGHAVDTAIRRGFGRSAGASALSVLTTAGALLTFSWSEIKPVQGVGVAMAVGLLASLPISWVVIPLALSRSKSLSNAKRTANLFDGRVRAMEGLADFVTSRWRLVLLVLVVLLALAAIGLQKVRTDYYYVGLFKPHTDIHRSYDYIDRNLRGGAAMEVLVDTGLAQDEAIKNPEVLRRMRTLQDRLETEFDALGVKTYSLADVVMEINQALHDGAAEAYRIPDTRAGVAEALLLFESSGNDELTKVVSGDFRKGRINVRLKYRPDSEYQPLLRAIEARARAMVRELPEVKAVEVTGVVPLWSQLTGHLGDSELRSISLSAIIVLVVMVLVFRSLSIGIAMAFCNLVPVALALAIMGYSGVFLDPFTLLVSAIAIGVLDDDTLHFVKSILAHYRDHYDMRKALRAAYSSTGLAMLLMSSVLVLGFLVYTLSEVESLAKFGRITAMAIGIGALCEFLFTPAVLMALEHFGWMRRVVPRHASVAHESGEAA